MCKFYSAIVTRNGELYHNTSLISHEDIIDCYNLKDNTLHNNLCRVEFYPDDNNDNLNVSKYNLHIDEDNIPDWFDIELKESVISRLKDIINNMIIKTNTKILCGNGYILSNGITINKLHNCIIYYCNNATIQYAGDATINNANSATINNANSATINNANSATIYDADHATINNANSATIYDADHATINNVDHATINNATIQHANSATINNANSATINNAGYACW